MKKMDSYKVFKGRGGVPSFSMRYNAEDEELEQLIEPPDSKDESEEGKESVMETSQDKNAASKDSPVTSKKSMKRSSSLDDQQPPHPPPPPGETWKFLTDIKGRITKTVEEKIEEIKSDRMKKKKKKNKLITGGENSSISDSEEKSSEAASVSQVSQVLSSSGGGTDIAGGEGSSDDDNEDDVTERDVSDSTPEQLSTAHIRGSIEVAEEALEEEDGLGVVGKIEGSPKRKGPLAKGNSKAHNFSMMAEFSERTMWLLRWSLVLPIVLALLFFYIPFSCIPSQLVWACVGGTVVLGLSWLKQRFWNISNCSSQRKKDDNSGLYFTGSFHVNSFHILPDQIRQLPSSADPQTILHQGWLNEYEEEYSDDRYRLRDTQCVWVSLRGSRLTLSIPQRSPPRRAFWSEPHHPKIFIRHRIYNLANCRVSLLPDGLTSKRLWSKKYPIYIKLDADSYIGSTYKEPHDKDQINKTTYSSLIDADFASEAFDEEKKESYSTIKEFTKKNEDGEALSDSTTQDDDDAGRVSEKIKGTSYDDDLEYTDFVHVSPSLIEKKIFLCLFARSDREKEIWFRRLIAAIGYSNFGNSDESPSITIKDGLQTLKGCRGKLTKSYLDFMYNLAQAMPKSEKRRRWRSKDSHSGSMWFNVFVSRIYYDFINDPVWMSKLQEKVQRKLSTVKVPSIVDELVVSRLVVEGPGPVVDGWTEPRLDSSGVWADIDISYQGLTSITIDILINLTRKKKDISSSLPPSPQKGSLGEKERSAVFNSSVEDSGESSSEDDERIDSPQHGSTVNSSISSRRSSSTAPSPPSVVNRITHKYFNQVAESKLVKKALEGVSSNTHISLIVEVKALVGTLVINIPPPPSNRLWYGFRPKPKLCLTARPVLGETVVSLVNISHWIEKKLYKEFEKVLVLPNMDDLVIPLMDRNIPF